MTLDDIVHCREFVQQLGFIVHKSGGVFINNTIKWTYQIAELDTSHNFATLYHVNMFPDGRPYFTSYGDHIDDLTIFKASLLKNIQTYKKYLSLYRLNHIDEDFI